MATIILTTCNNTFEANLLKGMLENNGIRSFLINENFSNLMPQFNGMLGAGVQIRIEESDLERANELISSQPTANEMVCPNCNSSNITFGLGTNRIRKSFVVVLSLFSGVPFGNIRNMYCCRDCGTEFKL